MSPKVRKYALVTGDKRLEALTKSYHFILQGLNSCVERHVWQCWQSAVAEVDNESFLQDACKGVRHFGLQISDNIRHGLRHD